jgi:hypothetical protein
MKDKFPEELEWVDGRSVFRRPESPASIVMMRSVVTSNEERDALSDVHARTRAERHAMSPDDIAQELIDFRAMQRHYAETGELPGVSDQY